MKRIRSTWAAVAALACAVPGLAVAQSTWNLYDGSSGGSGCTQNSANSGSYGNSWSCTGVGSAGTSLTASAWSPEKGTTSGDKLSYSGTYYANAYMGAYGNSGFGAKDRLETLSITSPDHAIDNITPGSFDFILLDFGSTNVLLDSIGVGWTWAASADVTVMRWNGAGAPSYGTGTTSTGGKKTLIDTGWQLVGSYKGLTADSSIPFGNTARQTGATQASSWWLVSAFNTTLNGSTSCKTAAGAATTCTTGDDGFKLNWIKTAAAPTHQTPEPASLALVAMGLLGVFGSMRRRS